MASGSGRRWRRRDFIRPAAATGRRAACRPASLPMLHTATRPGSSPPVVPGGLIHVNRSAGVRRTPLVTSRPNRGATAFPTGPPVATQRAKRGFHMRLKSIIAAAGFVTALAALAASPALAQEKRVYEKADNASPVCAGCHEQAHMTTRLTAHGAQNDADGSACQACHGDASLHLKDPPRTSRQRAEHQGRDGRAEVGDLPDLPRRVAAPRGLDVEQAPQGRRRLRQLPQHPRHAVRGESAQHQQRAVRGLAVHDDRAQPGLQGLRRLPPRHARRDPEALAPPDHRRQGHLPGLPRPARLAERRVAEERIRA